VARGDDTEGSDLDILAASDRAGRRLLEGSRWLTIPEASLLRVDEVIE
jgi:predicted nucleotidyltransferase